LSMTPPDENDICLPDQLLENNQLNPTSRKAAQLRYAEPPIQPVSWAPESSVDAY